MSDSMPATERRRTPRISALYLAAITSDGLVEEMSVTVGRTIDVSETGVRLETPHPLGIDDKVRLEIAIEETLVSAQGRVVRVMRTGALIEVGIDFTMISDLDRQALTQHACTTGSPFV